MSRLVCHACGAEVVQGEPIARDAECVVCAADLRACTNCRHWDPRYHNQCTETEADPIAERSRRNFCEYFFYSRAPYTPGASSSGRAADARAALDTLFGGRPAAPAPGAPSARSRFDALFGESKHEAEEEDLA